MLRSATGAAPFDHGREWLDWSEPDAWGYGFVGSIRCKRPARKDISPCAHRSIARTLSAVNLRSQRQCHHLRHLPRPYTAEAPLGPRPQPEGVGLQGPRALRHPVAPLLGKKGGQCSLCGKMVHESTACGSLQSTFKYTVYAIYRS